jgi:hypothetical protein
VDVPLGQSSCAHHPEGSIVSCQGDIQVLPHPCYSLELALTDYFLFSTLKRKLTGLTMTLMEFKMKWEGVIRTLTKDNFGRGSRGGFSSAKMHTY